MLLTRRLVLGVAALLVVLAATSLVQAQSETASQFYLRYRAAFDKASKMDEILPFMAKARVDEAKAMPAKDRDSMFQMIHEMGKLSDVTITKETATATGATLAAEGVDGSKHKTTGTIEIVKEDGAWKLSKESWAGGM